MTKTNIAAVQSEICSKRTATSFGEALRYWIGVDTCGLVVCLL